MSTIPRPSEFRGIFRTDDDARAVYSEGAGIARVWPAAVAVPVDVDDLRVLVAWATEKKIPMIARGSGSSMPNGAVGSGVIVDLTRWRTIGNVDTSSRTVRVSPGALRGDVDRAARYVGLRFPVDPSSGAFCTIGGMTATNAAGSHSLRFGAMRRWVRAIDCVFADGSRAEVRRGAAQTGNPIIDRVVAMTPGLRETFSRARENPRVLKNSSGYGVAEFLRAGDAVDLLVGSEGTLAFFVEIELDLAPAPIATSSVLGGFSSLDAAVTAAVNARAAGVVACELLDRTFLDVAASEGATRHLPPETEAALLAEVEADSAANAAAAALAVERIFLDAGATDVRLALEETSETELWELRHAASPILARLDPNLKSMQFIEDCAVPPEHLAEYVRGVRAALEENETRGVIFGHAGDAHVHVNPLIDVSRAGWRTRVDAILDRVTSLAGSLGGTLAGEHGDGRLRAPLLDRVWSADAIEAFREIKTAFDPLGLLNPGVKVPLADANPLDEIKYDPSLAPLPRKARAALDRVERHRAYSSFRLDLLEESS
jgi:FAD/FMN-containing dehydrogenase